MLEQFIDLYLSEIHNNCLEGNTAYLLTFNEDNVY